MILTLVWHVDDAMYFETLVAAGSRSSSAPKWAIVLDL